MSRESWRLAAGSPPRSFTAPPRSLTGFLSLPVRAHWYLAVICFPGLKGPVFEQNPLLPGPFPEPLTEEEIPEHCRPLSPERDGLDSSSEDPSCDVPEAATVGRTNGVPVREDVAFPEGESCGAPVAPGNSQAEAEQQFISESR